MNPPREKTIAQGANAAAVNAPVDGARYRGSARSRRPRLSLLKTRFERIYGGARQESDGE